MPCCSGASAMVCSWLERVRIPSAALCCWVPAWPDRPDFAWDSRSLALDFASEATWAASSFAVWATPCAALVACPATLEASSFATCFLDPGAPSDAGVTEGVVPTVIISVSCEDDPETLVH
jgi:hypothetical protein